MKTHHEKDLSYMETKEVINNLNVHIDRAQTRTSGALINLHIAVFRNVKQEEKDEKLLALLGYLIEIEEDLCVIRHSIRDLHKRNLKDKRMLHNMKKEFEKKHKEPPNPVIEDVQMPDIWNIEDI